MPFIHQTGTLGNFGLQHVPAVPKPWFSNLEGFTQEQASQVEEKIPSCL